MARKRKVQPGEIQGIEIRSSAGEFLAFNAASGESGVEVLFKDEMIWATQSMMAEIFDCSIANVSMHLKACYEDGELNTEATVKEFLTVQTEGSREVKRKRE